MYDRKIFKRFSILKLSVLFDFKMRVRKRLNNINGEVFYQDRFIQMRTTSYFIL